MKNTTFTPELLLVHNYLEKWARQTPDNQAVIQHETGKSLSYQRLNEIVDLYALCLVKLGVLKGDRIAAMALKSIPYLALQYACFKIGAIICPLDIKLPAHEAVRDLNKIAPRLFFMHGTTPQRDFTEAGKAILEECPTVEKVLQYSFPKQELTFTGVVSANDLFAMSILQELINDKQLIAKRDKMYSEVSADDPALIIFTTGTTGAPKPALLQHECIIAQMAIEERTSDMRGQEVRRMCVLPDSHVGGTTITTYSSIYTGGTNILTYRFQPEMTLEAIQKWGATWMGGVPTMYRMMWALPDYDSYDISSLRCVYYAGAGVDKKFLVKLSSMAPHFGTNLGMTECAGVSTYTPMPMTVEELLGQVGRAAEDIARISIRGKMNSDGTAGDELPLGEIGEICYHPPLVFKGYFGQPEETAHAISKEGILYTGDIGCFKDMGTYQGLFLMGRSKSMIKQKGYNVFPDEIALYISQLASVAEVVVIGLEHNLFDEAVFAFIIPEAGKKLTSEDVMTHCKGIASYKRPQHIEILADGSAFPVNKNGKVDKLALSEMAKKVIEKLRNQKKWDAI